MDADNVKHDDRVVPRPHSLPFFTKARENKTTTKWLACSRFASFDEDNVAVFISQKDSKQLRFVAKHFPRVFLAQEHH